MSDNLLANMRAEEDLAREVASHFTLLVDDFERRGMSPEERGPTGDTNA